MGNNYLMRRQRNLDQLEPALRTQWRISGWPLKVILGAQFSVTTTKNDLVDLKLTNWNVIKRF